MSCIKLKNHFVRNYIYIYKKKQQISENELKRNTPDKRFHYCRYFQIIIWFDFKASALHRFSITKRKKHSFTLLDYENFQEYH